MTGFDLDRFVTAQDATYEQALAELRAGGKRSHWMWFVFPQLAGLGRSAMAQRYALESADEARAYLAHPVLGPRLRACAAAALAADGSAADVFGGIDAVKLRSSMTLFDHVEPDAVFARVLERFYAGRRDDATTERL